MTSDPRTSAPSPFPDLGALAKLLIQQAGEDGSIDLTPAAIWGSSTRVPGLIEHYLGRADVILQAKQGDIPTSGPLTFPVRTPTTAGDTFLGLLDTPGTITFTLDAGAGNEVNFTLAIALDSKWTFATSFPALAADPVAPKLPFTAPQLLFDTTTSATQPLTFSSQVGIPADDVNDLAVIHDLLPGVPTSVNVSGAINPGPEFVLKTNLLPTPPPPLGKIVTIGPPYLGIQVIQVPYLGSDGGGGPDGSAATDPPKTYTALQWLVGADVTLGTGTGSQTLMLAIVAQPGAGMFGFEIAPPTPAGTTIGDIATALLGPVPGSSFEEFFSKVPFAEQFLEGLNKAFAFKGFTALFSMKPLTPLAVMVSVGSQLDSGGKPVYPLTLIPGVLSVDDFEVQWTILSPADSNARQMLVNLSAVLDFAPNTPGKYLFDLQVSVPNFTVAGKYAGPPLTLDLKQVEDELFGGHLHIPLDVEVTFTGLSFEASPPTSYTMTIEAGGAISLFGTSILSITNGVLTVGRTYPQQAQLGERAAGPQDDPPVPKNNLSFTGVIGIGQLQFDVSASLGTGTDTVFTIHMVHETVGGLLTYLVSLVDPYLDLRLEPPWDKLNSISLDSLVFTINATKGSVSVTYPIGLDLGFMTIKNISLAYQRASTDKDGNPVPSSVQVEVSGSFLGLSYGGDSGKPALGWNPVTDRAPAVPGKAAALFDLQYLGLGQHVKPSTGDLATIQGILDAMRKGLVPLDANTKDPTKQPSGVEFAPDAGWLIATDFTIMGTVQIQGVFSDPDMAGIRITLSGDKAGSFAGLAFEILYIKVTPTIGLYHFELTLPTAMRHLEFGEVSVTLPTVDLDIYTNGNFRIDFGFPQGLDFSRSFSVQVFPFVGYGGFYFALLNGQTSKRVPQITNGQFNPVVEFGVGLSLGVGKTIDEGVFSAGASVTLVGIVQGVIGWFEPSDTSAASDRYFWIQGSVALVGKVFGKVDFAIISVDIEIELYASVTFTVEAYQPTLVALVAHVEASASIKILFITIHFSFSLTLNLSFTIGSASTPPWRLAPAGGSSPSTLSAQLAGRPSHAVLAAVHTPRMQWLGLTAPAARAPAFDWTPRSVSGLLAGTTPEVQGLDVVLVPAFTVVDGVAQCVLLPFVENSIPTSARNAQDVQDVADAAADASFNQLAIRLFAWTVGALGEHMDGPGSVVTWDDLQHVASQLYSPDIAAGPFSYANLRDFVAANFSVRLAARTPGATAESSGTLFPILPELAIPPLGADGDFSTHTPVDATYQQAIDAYLQSLEVAYENAVQKSADKKGAPASDGDETAVAGGDPAHPPSMATVVFENWCAMVARAAVDAAISTMRAYPYEVPASGAPSLAGIAGSFPAAEAVYVTVTGDSPASVAAAHSVTTAALRALNPGLSPYQDTDALPVGMRLEVPVVVTPVTIVAANQAKTGILSTTSKLPLNGIQYQVRTGDTFTSIAAVLTGTGGHVTCPSGDLATELMSANVGAAVLQPGVALPVSGNPLSYTTQTGDTLALVAATYVVRAAGAAVLNLIPGLLDVVAAMQQLNPKTGGGTWGPNEPITDDTVITLPDTVQGIDVGGGTRVARMGDTLTRIAATVLAPQTPAVPLAPTVAALIGSNYPNDPPAPDAALTAGTVLVVPPPAAVVQPGDTFTTIATSFGIGAATLGAGFLDTPVLMTGAVLVVPPIDYAPGTSDSLGGIAGTFNLGIEELTAAIEGVDGLFLPSAKIVVPQVPALTLGQLQHDLLASGDLNNAAASISRFMLHGLRLPTEPSAPVLGTSGNAGLYFLIGQQLALPDPLGDTDVVLTSPSAPTWLQLYMGGYVVRSGDDLGRISARFAPADTGAFESALTQLNPGVDLQNLEAGQALIFPGADSYLTVAGDTLALVTSRFAAPGMETLFASELATANPGVDFTQPLPTGTELVLPIQDSYTTVLGETLDDVAALFVGPDDTAAFEQWVLQNNPGVQTGQPIPPGTVLALPPVATRIPLAQLELSFTQAEAALIAALQSDTFDPGVTRLERLPLYREVPNRYSLQHVLHWQCAALPPLARFTGATPAAGEPTLWPFPSSLQKALKAAGDPEPIYQLMTAKGGSPAERAVVDEVGTYAWGTAAQIRVRQIPGPDGPLANRYLLIGADESDRDALAALWDYLNGPGASLAQSATLLYPPDPATANPNGFVSDLVAPDATFVVKTNLSTVSHGQTTVALGLAEQAPPADPYLYSATIEQVKDLVRLTWECSVVNSGGYYLSYATSSGAGLPDHLFTQGPEATLTLLVLVDDGVPATRPPVMHAAHNCALAVSNVDAGSSDVFVQPFVHVATATDTLTSICAELLADYALTTSPDALATLNAAVKGLLLPGVELDYVRDGVPGTHPVVYGDTFGSVAALIGGDVTPATLGTANKDDPIFRPGALLELATGELQVVAGAPPGSTGFYLERPEATDPAGIESLFQLLAYSMAAGGGFLQSPEGLPVSPVESADSGTDGFTAKAIRDPAQPVWIYDKLLPAYRYAADGWGATAPAGLDLVLPSPWDDPYRGIAPGAQATLELSFRDVYGNVAPGTPSQLAIPVGYFDALDGLDRWPSVAAAYTFVSGTPPACRLAFTFDPSTYVAGSGLSVAAAVRNAAARACRYAEIYRQVRRRDVSVTLTSSLDQPASPAPPTPYPLDKQAFVALAGSAYAFLTAASGLVAYEHPVVDGETFAQIAGQYEVSVVDLAKANDALDASLLFADKLLSVPTYYTFHHGDTLAITKLTTEQITEGSLDVPLNEGTDVSRVSQTLTYALQDGDTLRHIAFETSAAAASVAAANHTAPLTSGLTMTAGSATAVTGAGLASGQHDTLDTMVARFAALKVPTTPADLGVANQDTANLFDASAQAELTIADYVLQAGDTLRSLAARAKDPLATGPLLGDNQNVPDLFPAGAALWESNQSYALETGDTLAAVAARFAIDLSALMGLSANQTAALVHGENLVVPAQVTFGAGGAPGSTCMMGATDTLTKVAARYGAQPDTLVTLNRYTQDLFVPGSISVAGVQLTVTVTDTFDSLFAQATAAGYSGAFSDFAPAIAAAIDGGGSILAEGVLLACPPMVVGAGISPAVAQTLAAVAAGYGVSPHSLVSANGSLRSLLRAGVTISLTGPDGPVPVTIGADDTLLTLVARFAVKGVPLTLDDFATSPDLSGGDILALGANLVPPPVDVTATVPFAATPQNPDVIFPVVVSVTLARDPALVDPDFADVADVASATTRIPPQAERTSDDPALTLQAFAASFEEAFPGLKVAVSQKQGSGASAQGQVWAADFRPDGIQFSVPASGTPNTPNASAAYFALPPISTTLLTYDDVSIQPYVSGSGLQPSAPHRFAAVDVDVWASQFFSAVDTFLSPTFAAGVRTVDGASLDAVVAHKLTIAQRLADKVIPVFTDGAQGDVGAAREELLQQLLVLLGNADSIDTIAQLPVDVSASPYSSASTAPRLSGTPAVPGAAPSDQAGYALSPAKVPLAKTTSSKETSSLTFAVSVKQPAADRTLELDDVAYAIGELEIGIHDVSGIADYQQSSWLTLLCPLSVPLGELLIPIPLRVAPTPPTMVGQTATATPAAGSPTLPELKLWDYAFCFDQPATDQDTRYVSVTFNAPPPTTHGPKGPDDVRKLFDELAQFVSVYPQVQQDLTLLPVLPPGTPSPTVSKAVSVFADLVGRVADAWAGVADDASTDDGEAGITVEYEVDAPTGSGEMTLTTSAAPSIPWPDIWAIDPSGKHHQLAGETPAPGATSRKYTFPSGVPDTTAKYEWRFPALDVTALQSGVASMYVVRNQDLGSATQRTVAGELVYETSVAEFSNPVIPLVVVQDLVPIRPGSTSLADALHTVFAQLFGAGWPAEIRLAGRYGYELGPSTGDLRAELPIFVVTSQTLTDDADAQMFCARVEAVVDTWNAAYNPNPSGGWYLFDLAVFATHVQSATQPVLDLRNLFYSLS